MTGSLWSGPPPVSLAVDTEVAPHQVTLHALQAKPGTVWIVGVHLAVNLETMMQDRSVTPHS